MSKKAWIIFAIVVIGALVALVLTSRGSSSQIDVSNIDAAAIQPALEANGNIADNVYGKTDSKVVFVEYGDFQCPGCKSANPRIAAIAEAYKDHISFTFRNFPITQIHPNALSAAAVAQAAGLQDRYWEMHDLLYENQDAWKSLSGSERNSAFLGYATSLGLDTTKFNEDLASTSISQKIKFDQALAKKVSVNSTPTFFLNGVKLESDTWGSEAKLVEVINTELEKAGITPPDYTVTGL